MRKRKGTGPHETANDVDLFDKVRGLSQTSVIVVVDYTGKKNSICCCAQILPAKWR